MKPFVATDQHNNSNKHKSDDSSSDVSSADGWLRDDAYLIPLIESDPVLIDLGTGGAGANNDAWSDDDDDALHATSTAPVTIPAPAAAATTPVSASTVSASLASSIAPRLTTALPLTMSVTPSSYNDQLSAAAMLQRLQAENAALQLQVTKMEDTIVRMRSAFRTVTSLDVDIDVGATTDQTAQSVADSIAMPNTSVPSPNRVCCFVSVLRCEYRDNGTRWFRATILRSRHASYAVNWLL